MNSKESNDTEINNKKLNDTEVQNSKKTLTEQVDTEQIDKDNFVKSENHFKEIDPRDEKILNLEAELVELKNSERDTILRIKAEMENLRRRTEQDIERMRKFALERFIDELLPVADSLDRALEVANIANPDLSSMIKGIELTLKSMQNIMHKFGVEVIDNINIPMDPNVHQAVAVVESEDIDAGNVTKIIQKGYTLNGRTIRAAMVTVAKSKI